MRGADGVGAGSASASRPDRGADPWRAPRRPAAGQPRGDDSPRRRAARARGHAREPSRRRGSVAGPASRHGLQRLGCLQVARGPRLGDAATALSRAGALRGRDDRSGRRCPAARWLSEQLLAARWPRALERSRDGARALLRRAPDPGGVAAARTGSPASSASRGVSPTCSSTSSAPMRIPARTGTRRSRSRSSSCTVRPRIAAISTSRTSSRAAAATASSPAGGSSCPTTRTSSPFAAPARSSATRCARSISPPG